MASADFVHLHLHTEFSLLDAALIANSTNALMIRAKEQGAASWKQLPHGNQMQTKQQSGK